MTTTGVAPQVREGVQRLRYIDALRGFAAAVVCLSHLVLAGPNRGTSGALLDRAGRALPGRDMVSLFLLLSAFSLYHSERSRRLAGKGATTLRRFAARRFWRVAPTFYAAFVVAAVVVSLPGMYRDPAPVQSRVTPGGVLSHLFFVHNLRGSWEFQANGPLWSIAAEMQLYVLFPLLAAGLLLSHRLGRSRWLLLGACLLLAQGVYRLAPGSLTELARWFVLGLLVAEVASSRVRIPAWVVFVGLLSYVAALVHGPRLPLLALAFVTVVLGLDAAERQGGFRMPRWAQWVGVRSYSLYAWHWPLLLLLSTAQLHASLEGDLAVAVRVAVGFPLALLLAAAMYRMIERPSLARARSA